LKYKNGDEVSDSIGLLISILVRYPEVGSTNYDPESRKLALTFTLSQLLDNEPLQQFKNKCISCIETFHYLENRKPNILNLKYSAYEGLTVLEVQRDVETITHNEIALIISLLHQDFANILVADANDSLMEEDLELQEEMIGHALENIKGSTLDKKLIAFREEGRVLVFNK
jgi:hypothetical protein